MSLYHFYFKLYLIYKINYKLKGERVREGGYEFILGTKVKLEGGVMDLKFLRFFKIKI